MSRDGAGNYSLPSGNPVVTNTIISSNGWANPTLNDIAAALTQSLSRDGQTTPTADLTMGNFKLRNLAAAIARTDAVNAGQIQDNTLTQLSSVSGTDTITASTSPAITAYTAGQIFCFQATGPNTTNAVTLNLNSLGAKAVTKIGTSGVVQLSPGDIQSGQFVAVMYDGTQFQFVSNTAPNIPIPFSNYFVNGNFDIWQRGTSFTNAASAAAAYTADGWQVYRGSFASGYTVLRGSGSPDKNSSFSLFIQRTAGDTSTQTINAAQSFETNDIIKIQGKTVTVSVRAQASGAFVGSLMTLVATFGTGTDGNIAAGFTGGFGAVNSNVTLTNTYQTYSLTFVVPNNATQMACLFTLNPSSTAAGASDFVQFDKAQLNEGASVLPAERRNLGLEFIRCLRYYRLLGIVQQWGYAGAGNFIGQTVTYADMRVAPSVTINSPTYANASGATVNTATTNSLSIFATVTALGAASFSCNLALNSSL